ncbi:MAG: hypothetical protein AAF292_06185 [Pseudomonadota bacterium]
MVIGITGLGGKDQDVDVIFVTKQSADGDEMYETTVFIILAQLPVFPVFNHAQ